MTGPSKSTPPAARTGDRPRPGRPSWRPRCPARVPGREGGMGGSVIFAGVADGTICRYDCTTAIVTGPIGTGRVLVPLRGPGAVSHCWKSTLRMTVENRGLRAATKVWALEALSD